MSATDPRRSSAFDQLSEPVRRWAWRQGWDGLRDIQEQAVTPILEGRDVVLAAATASGKTEAAFLPLLSRLERQPGLRIVAVSPLKALINDQARRLQSLGEAVAVPVTPWHGDVPASVKDRLRRRPAGVLLITPESLEAMLVTRGSGAAAFFAAVDYVVVDELHSFLGDVRGRQLQSLLHRIELVVGRTIPRVGLSATLGDLAVAGRCLRPQASTETVIVESTVQRRDVRLQIRGYEEPLDEEVGPTAGEQSSDHLHGVVSAGTHIVFANRRAAVEERVQALKRRAGPSDPDQRVWPHHGSLSREAREDAETALRSGRPATVVATTTLELGIDVGSVDTIVQLGPPPSVASMRQRLGRSGRREGDPSTLRVYIEEQRLTAKTVAQDRLRTQTVQACAMVELLIDGFNETPSPASLHLSTLVQQTLSLVAQHGGTRADDAWRALCGSGPFDLVDRSTFAQLLRDLGAHDLLAQTHDGTLILGLEGERLVNRYDFYAAFQTTDEYRLVAGPQTLGTLPVTHPVMEGDFLLFAGRRWRVLKVRDKERVIELVAASAGRAPSFDGGAALVGDRVRTTMRRLYETSTTPNYLDAGARDLLRQGRSEYALLNLAERPVLEVGSSVALFPWVGDRALDTLALLLLPHGIPASRDGAALIVREGTVASVTSALAGAIADPQLQKAVAQVQNKVFDKHHRFLSDELLTADYLSSRLDLATALGAAEAVLEIV